LTNLRNLRNKQFYGNDDIIIITITTTRNEYDYSAVSQKNFNST